MAIFKDLKNVPQDASETSVTTCIWPVKRCALSKSRQAVFADADAAVLKELQIARDRATRFIRSGSSGDALALGLAPWSDGSASW